MIILPYVEWFLLIQFDLTHVALVILTTLKKILRFSLSYLLHTFFCYQENIYSKGFIFKFIAYPFCPPLSQFIFYNIGLLF